MKAFIQKIPLWVRKFVVDSVETFVGAVFALQIALPHSMDEATVLAAAVGAAALAAVVSAARRAAPAFLAWFASIMGTDEDPA